MTAPKSTVLVTGATGNQGGAVAKALLSHGYCVRGFTRNPNSEAARRLKSLGAELAVGDFNDINSLKRAMQNVDTIYAMGTPRLGPAEETKEGIALVEAAIDSKIGHFIYGSVASANQNTGVPHFDSKYQVEKFIEQCGIPYTISAPVSFMENLLFPWAFRGDKILRPLPGDRKLQQIAISDIGEFVAALVTRRERVFKMRFDIAGDELSGKKMASILSQITHKNINYETISIEDVKSQSLDMALMFEWFDKVGFKANIELLRKEFPEVHWFRFEDWAREQNWEKLLPE